MENLYTWTFYKDNKKAMLDILSSIFGNHVKSKILTELARATASSSALPKCPQNITAIGCIVNCNNSVRI